MTSPAGAGRYVLLIGLLMVPHAAQAQTGRTDRVRISVNFGVQPASENFSASTTKPLYRETATINTTYGVSSGTLFDGGVLVRVAGGFHAGVAVSSFSKSETASLTGMIPHPFFFNTLRPISGVAGALKRSEVGVHVQAAYVISAGHVDVAIAGGPTFFNVSQDLVADVVFAETYPYDTATFTSATIAKVSETKVGFNAGVDVGVKLSKNVGVGGLVRFARASMTFPLPNTAAGVSADVGGLQAGGGVRLFF